MPTTLSTSSETFMTSATYNGWANYETWNVSLWIQNDQFLYNTAKACVEYCGKDETPYDKFVRCMFNGGMNKTRDGVSYSSSKLDHQELNEMLKDI